MPLLLADQKPGIGQLERCNLCESRGRDRVGIAGQKQNRRIAFKRRLETVVEQASRPDGTNRIQGIDNQRAKLGRGKILI